MANIFYGISSESHVGKKIDRWISIAGIPDVFSERDGHLIKYQTKLLGKYDVVSIDEALKRYPDADVWITYGQPGYVPGMLATKLPTEKIRFLEADLEYRKGCSFLGNTILYRENSFSPCCSTGQGPVFKVSGPVLQRLIQWQDDTTKLVDDVRHERPNKCQKCHRLKDGFWRKSVKLNQFIFGATSRSDVCNFHCIYCLHAKKKESLKDVSAGNEVYEIIQQLSEIPEHNSEALTIGFGNGEFCAYKHCDDTLDIFLKTKWRMNLFSNCSIYKEQISTLMEGGRIKTLVTSLDAGTRETFEKIKQRDMFDRVVENLRRYPLSKTQFDAKYIFLDGINDNEKDVDGFYEIVKEVGGAIMLSSDRHLPYTEKMREMALRMIKKAKADGIRIIIDNVYLNPLDAKFISENCAKT